MNIRDRWDRATDRLPLRQLQAVDFGNAAWAMRFFWLFFAMAAVSMLLAGCITDGNGPKSSVAGSCAVFDRPPYVVLGKTQYDQDVADGFVESGVAGCNWARPAARPPELDRAPPPKPVAVQPAKRKGILARVKHKVAKIIKRPAKPTPASTAFPDQPVAPVTATPVAPEPSAAPPAPPPRSRIEQLLRPNG